MTFIETFISSELFEASDYWTYLLFNIGFYGESTDSIKIKELIYVNLLLSLILAFPFKFNLFEKFVKERY